MPTPAYRQGFDGSSISLSSGCLLHLAFVTKHGAQLFAKFGRVLMSVRLDGMLNGNIQDLFFVSRNRDVAWFFGWEPTAIDDFAVAGHDSPPVMHCKA